MKSKTKIEKQLQKKTNTSLVETVILAKKNPAWLEVGSILTGPSRKRKEFNISEIANLKGSIFVICGKLLGQGEITKKCKVVAIKFSESAEEKLLKAGCEVVLLADEIKQNKEAKGVTILK